MKIKQKYMISKHIIPHVKSSFPSTVPTELVTNFLALSIGYIFSRFFHHAVAHFHAFSTGLHVYFSSFHQLDVFPRFSPVSCFLAFRTAYMFSRSFRRLHVFPPFTPATYFPVLHNDRIFPAFYNGCMLSCANC